MDQFYQTFKEIIPILENTSPKTIEKGTYSNSFPGANIPLIQKSEKDSKKTIEQHPSWTQSQKYLELLLNQIQRYILKKKQHDGF